MHNDKKIFLENYVKAILCAIWLVGYDSQLLYF